VLGFGFDEVNQSSSSGPDPLFSDPLHFRVESKFTTFDYEKIYCIDGFYNINFSCCFFDICKI
jgi:hypothetical protein